MRRQVSLIIACTILIIGSIFSVFDFKENVLAVGRFVYGFGALGMFSVIVPKYIEETVPVEVKAQYGCLSYI